MDKTVRMGNGIAEKQSNDAREVKHRKKFMG